MDLSTGKLLIALMNFAFGIIVSLAVKVKQSNFFFVQVLISLNYYLYYYRIIKVF